MDSICSVLYKKAKRKGTIEALETYRKSVPEAYYYDSQEQIIAIEWGTDSKAWQKAVQENTISAYQKYLSMYPNGSYKKRANKKIIDMEVAEIHGSKHGKLPQMDKIGYGYGTNSTIYIKNSTNYTLTILYSGTDSKRVTIAPNMRTSVSLSNGLYRIAATVSASNVRNFAGTENLTGDTYNVEYYISSSYY